MFKLYNGDCFEVMKNIADKSIDCVITDPPFEFKKGGFGGGKKSFSNRAFKSQLKNNPLLRQTFDCDKLMNELERIYKRLNVVIFCNETMLVKLLNYAVERDYIYTITHWLKTNPTPYTNQTYLNDIEYIICIRERGTSMYGSYKTLSKVYKSSVNKKDKNLYGGHPTIKPLELVTKYVINHTKENDIVLDCYMGSGTTGVACKNLNRNFIGIELDKNYFEIAKKRIDSIE